MLLGLTVATRGAGGLEVAHELDAADLASSANAAAGRPSARSLRPAAGTGNGGGCGHDRAVGVEREGRAPRGRARAGPRRSAGRRGPPCGAGGRRPRRARRPAIERSCSPAIPTTGKRQSACTNPSAIAAVTVASQAVLPRADAVAALTGEPFDVLVIGGGITGAGVALDAATRGYCVALVERGDFAGGTSSRSSKLVHGGLRYLQNFDLGLVREALLERQINVELAPYLVKPLRFVVPAFDGARLDRVVGLGLNMYDVMAVEDRRRRSAAAARARTSTGARRATVDLRREVVELVPALARRAPDRRLPVLRLPDRRCAARAHGPGRGRALRRGGGQPGRGGRAARGRRRAGAGARRRDRRGLGSAPPTWSTRPGCGPTGCGRPSCTTRPRCRSSGPAAARTWSSPRRCRWPRGRSCPRAGGRTIFVLPWLGRR